MATREIVVNMVPGGVTPVIHVSQYDDGYGITANLIENSGTYTVPVGATVSIEGTKPDGHGYAYLCTYQDNAVVIPVNTQMTAVKGKHPCELVVRKEGLRVGSKNMIMAVEVAGLGEDTIISDTELPAIIALAQEQEEAAAASATAAASSAESSETAKDAAMDAAQDAIDAAQELQTAIQFNAALIHETASGAVASFADGADNIPMQSVVAEITPVQSGSGDPSPSNVRAISGRTGLTVTRAGRNLLKLPYKDTNGTRNGITFTTNADGSVTINGTASPAVSGTLFASAESDLPLNVGDVLYFSAGQTYNENSAYMRLLYADNFSGIGRITRENFALTLTAAMIERGFVFQIWVPNGVTVNNMTFKPMMSKASIEEWQSPTVTQTIPIAWESIAGTVYGGTLDVVSGVLTVDKGYINYDGSENWNWQTDGTYKRAACPLSDVYNPGGRVSVQSNAGTFRASGNDVGTIFASGTTLFYYPDASITSLADYKTWLASNNLQIVYPLATPQTYQLTPTEVRTILGGNTIYTDAGDVSVEYIADTKLYIDNKIAELQALVLENN